MKHSSITVGNYYNWRPNELNLGKLDIYKMRPSPPSSHNLLSENYNKYQIITKLNRRIEND